MLVSKYMQYVASAAVGTPTRKAAMRVVAKFALLAGTSDVSAVIATVGRLLESADDAGLRRQASVSFLDCDASDRLKRRKGRGRAEQEQHAI